MLNIFESIKAAYEGTPEKIAVICEQQQLTFNELKRKVESTCALFRYFNIQPKDQIIVISPNNIDFVVITLAIAKLGCTIIPLPLGTSTTNFTAALKSSNASHVISWHASLIEYKSATDAAQINGITNWFALGKDIANLQCIDTLLTNCNIKQNIDIRDCQIDVNLPYILTMTSGSTGAPKPISLSQKTKMLRAASAIDCYGVTANDKTIIGTPLYHSLAERLMFVSLLTGGTLVILPKFTIDVWIENIKKHQITFTMAVSSQLKQLLNKSSDDLENLNSLRCLVSSSALLEFDTKRQLLEKLSCDFHECYGASEVACVSDIKFNREIETTSVGKAIKGVDIKILDDNNQSLDTGQIGEIAVRSDLEFSGYFEQPLLTEQSYYQNYFKTGDLGYLDKSGNLFFKGRKKEIIISGGINIYPSDIEDSMLELTEISSCVAFSLPCDNLGEVVGLAITSSEMISDEILSRKVKIQSLTRLDAPQIPKHLFVYKDFPVNSVGKVDKLKIVKMCTAMLNNNKQYCYQIE